METSDGPDGSHETVHEELVLFCGCLCSGIPHLGIASLHEPSFEVDRVGDVGIGANLIGRKREGLEGRVEVCDSVLGEETNEVEPADGKLAFRKRESGSVRANERLAVRRGGEHPT